MWWFGYPDQVLEKCPEALAQAQKLSHPFSQALAISFAAWLHQFRQQW
jgi:hypothetical protein